MSAQPEETQDLRPTLEELLVEVRQLRALAAQQLELLQALLQSQRETRDELIRGLL